MSGGPRCDRYPGGTGIARATPRHPKPENTYSPRHARAMLAPRPRHCPVPPGLRAGGINAARVWVLCLPDLLLLLLVLLLAVAAPVVAVAVVVSASIVVVSSGRGPRSGCC
eukprot:gene8126-biopygen22594